MRGLFELEDLTAKKGYTLPNPIISLDMILSKSVDGFNMDMYNKERARLKGALSTGGWTDVLHSKPQEVQAPEHGAETLPERLPESPEHHRQVRNQTQNPQSFQDEAAALLLQGGPQGRLY